MLRVTVILFFFGAEDLGPIQTEIDEHNVNDLTQFVSTGQSQGLQLHEMGQLTRNSQSQWFVQTYFCKSMAVVKTAHLKKMQI